VALVRAIVLFNHDLDITECSLDLVQIVLNSAAKELEIKQVIFEPVQMLVSIVSELRRLWFHF